MFLTKPLLVVFFSFPPCHLKHFLITEERHTIAFFLSRIFHMKYNSAKNMDRIFPRETLGERHHVANVKYKYKYDPLWTIKIPRVIIQRIRKSIYVYIAKFICTV